MADEWLIGGKIALSSVVGGIVSMGFIQLPAKKRAFAVASGAVMAHFIAMPISKAVGLEPSATGFLIGLFGMSICHLLFESLKKSDLSVKWSDIAALFRRTP